MEFSVLDSKVDYRKLLLLFAVLCVGIVVFARTDAWTVARVALAGSIFWFLVKKPELALAIQFNGFSLYLYLLYKLNIEPETFTTAAFYAVLSTAYLLGGFHLARKRKQFRFSWIDLGFAVLYALFYVSYFLFSTDNQAATRKITYAPLLVIAPYIGVRLLASRDQVIRFLTYAALMAVVMMLPAFYELAVNPLYSGEYGRFSAYVFTNKSDNPILFSIGNAFLLIVILFRISQQRSLKWVDALLIVPAVFLMLRSGARGPVVSFLVMLFFYVAWLGWVSWRTKVALFFSLLVLLGGVYRFIPETTASFYEDLLQPDIRPAALNTIQERIVMIDYAIKEFTDHPVFGVGTGNSAGGTGYPHNVLLEVAAEFGIFGILIFLMLCSFVVSTALKYLRRAEDDPNGWLMNLALALFIFSFVEALFSAYMGGDTLFYGSIALIAVVGTLTEHERAISERAADYLRKRALAFEEGIAWPDLPEQQASSS